MNRLFNLYTNSQEYKNDFPDRFGRARFYNSQNVDILNPVISKEIYARGFRPHYPGNKKFAVCISYDIDHLFLNESPQRKLLNAGKGLVHGQFSACFAKLKSLFKNQVQDEYNLRRLLAINNEYKIRSTYYFLALEKNEEDYNYFLYDVRDQLQYALNCDGEIGLHGGHKAFNDLTKLAGEKQRLEDWLGAPVFGYRNHYLKFELPATWNILQMAGFLYDTTLSYVDCIGFRNGMCYPFYPFDVIKNEFLDIVELPLIIMDVTLFYYMRMNPPVAFKICKQIIEEVKECHGVLTLLWHNNFLSGEMGSFYLELVHLLKKEDPWFATSLELVKWWKEENLLKQSQKIITDLIGVS